MKNAGNFEDRTYAGLKSLAELPYFEWTDKGLLRLTVDGLEGGVDGHTHFSTNALSGPKPDILAKVPETKYYLDRSSPLRMDNYMGLPARRLSHKRHCGAALCAWIITWGRTTLRAM